MTKDELSIVDEFEKRFGAQAAFERARNLIFAYVSRIRSPLPALAIRGMDVARRFREGTATPEERMKAQQDIWDHISDRHAWRDPSPQYSLLRAVIFLMNDRPGPNEIGHISEVVRECLYMVDCFEDHSDTVASLLQRYFSTES